MTIYTNTIEQLRDNPDHADYVSAADGGWRGAYTVYTQSPTPLRFRIDIECDLAGHLALARFLREQAQIKPEPVPPGVKVQVIL